MSKTDMLKIFILAGISTSLIVSHHNSNQLVPTTKNSSKIEMKTSKQKLDEFEQYANKIKAERDALEEHKRQEEQKKIQEQKEKEEKEWIPVRLSFYTNDMHDCGKTDAIGASGKNLSRGSEQGVKYVASPSDIPFGTRLYIENYGEYEVADRGGAINYSDGVMKLDVFIPNASQEYLNALGVKYTKAKILKTK